MRDDKPKLIQKWIYGATNEQIYNATNYMRSKGFPPPYAPSPQQSLVALFINELTQANSYPPEKWIIFQKMTAHCRQVKHTLHSGKVKLSASIGKEYKEKLERVAKEMKISQSAVLELLIENADKIKSKQKQGRRGVEKSHHPSAGNIPTGPEHTGYSHFVAMAKSVQNIPRMTMPPIPNSGYNKDEI